MYGGNDKGLAEIAAEVKKDRHRPRRGSRLAADIRRRRMRAIAHHPRARH